MSNSTNPAVRMWSDHEADLDLLGFNHLVDAVTSIIQAPNLLPATIGVFGDWGSGKSTLLNLVGDDLAKEPNVLVLKFNGWLFEGYDDAKAALLETIVDGIAGRETTKPKAKRIALKLLRKVNWLRATG